MGIALSPNVKIIDINNILEGRILLVMLILHGIKLSAFCAYAPTEKYADSSKQAFFNTLQKSILQVKKEHPRFKIIVGADMNATILVVILMAPGPIWAPITMNMQAMIMELGFLLCERNVICTS